MTPEFLTSAPGATPVTLQATFQAEPERVFRAWTTADDVLRWFGNPPGSLASAALEPRVGGRWRFEFAAGHALTGEYLEVEPQARLVFTWVHEKPADDGATVRSPTSQVTVEFEPVASGTRLSLRHERLSTEDARRGVGGGWSRSFAALGELVA